MAARVFLSVLFARTLAQTAENDVCEAEATAVSVVMLQQQVSVKSAAQTSAKALQAPAPSPEQRMQDALPVNYFHIPKTGTTFITAILTLPGVCEGEGEPPFVSPGEFTDEEWAELRLPELCPGFDEHAIPKHACLQPRLPGASGQVMGMFRQPEQRLISFHGYMLEYAPDFTDPDVRVFFESGRGGMVYQLTHTDPAENFCWRIYGETVTDTDVEEAVRMVEEDFAFVGITEQWDLSICLLHEMFGGLCREAEFADVRPGTDPETGEVRETGSQYNVSVLEGAVDTQDRILYDAALRVFERRLEEFGVTAEICEQGCWTARP